MHTCMTIRRSRSKKACDDTAIMTPALLLTVSLRRGRNAYTIAWGNYNADASLIKIAYTWCLCGVQRWLSRCCVVVNSEIAPWTRYEIAPWTRYEISLHASDSAHANDDNSLEQDHAYES